MHGAAKVSDDELLLELDANDEAARERVNQAKMEEEKKKQEQEQQKRREEQILDYSAKVSGGFIEVKIGEDEDAMWKSYQVHMDKWGEFMNNHTQEEADKIGLHYFTWEEWKKEYRRTHGLPEDGIRRIPFEGKPKPRQVDWTSRKALSMEELAKHGIQVSEDGPVMIPLDKAMAAAGSLLQGAKTIYAVRDGLEVMRNGLDTETSNLKKKFSKGVPIAVIQNQPQEGGAQTTLSMEP